MRNPLWKYNVWCRRGDEICLSEEKRGEERRGKFVSGCRAVTSPFGSVTNRVQTHFKVVMLQKDSWHKLKRRKTLGSITVALQSGDANHITRLCAAPTCMVQVNPKRTSATQHPHTVLMLPFLSLIIMSVSGQIQKTDQMVATRLHRIQNPRPALHPQLVGTQPLLRTRCEGVSNRSTDLKV